MLATAGVDVLLEYSMVLVTEDSVCGDDEDKTSDTVFNNCKCRIGGIAGNQS